MSAQPLQSLDLQSVENRLEPRYQVSASGFLCGVPIALRNISRSGAQVACTVRKFARIRDVLEAPRVPVALMLRSRIDLEAQVVYAHRQDDHYLIGLLFVWADAARWAQVDEYVSTLR